ncbi:hypothetical protein MMC17_001609 [Xylographa soralifera]|nr:hypothetical protein [Xylographa soralifera]
MEINWTVFLARQGIRVSPFPATFDPFYNSLNQLAPAPAHLPPPPPPPPPPYGSRGPIMAPPAPLWQSRSNGPIMAPRVYESPYNRPATPQRRPPIPTLPANPSRGQLLATAPTKTSGFGFDETDEPSSPSVAELWAADLDSEVWRRQLKLWEVA